MLSDVRQSLIVEKLNTEGYVKVDELSKLFKITKKTVREDLEKLDHQGILKRVRGGAVLVDDPHSMLPIAKRRVRQYDEKEQIARAAYELIEDGQTVLLDGGSTTLELAKLLNHRQITVITNDTRIAATLEESHTIELCILGGYRRKGTSTIIGPNALDMLKELNVDIAFIGCTGVDLVRGLSILHQEEAELKKSMLAASSKKVVLADHSKFERSALWSFAKLSDMDILVTDEQTNADILQDIVQLGVTIIIP